MHRVIILILLLSSLFFDKINAKSINLVKDVDFKTFSLKYKGTIDSRLHISVFLNQVDDKIKGIYYYDNNKYYLTLDGTVSKSGNCIIFENNYKGKITGKFEGLLNNEKFSGTWKNADNTKELNFELMNEAPLKTGDNGEATHFKHNSNVLIFSLLGFALMVLVGMYFFKKRKSEPINNLVQVATPVAVPTTANVEAAKLTDYNKYEVDATQKSFNEEQILEVQDPEDVGFKFEDYIAKKFLSLNNPDKPKYFSIHTWQGDKRTTDGTFAKSNGNPDFVFDFNFFRAKGQFSVECKYHWKKYKTIDIATTTQLTRYKLFAKTEGLKVYVVIGLEGTPENPKELFCIPLEDINFPNMDYEDLNNNYRIHNFNFDQNLKMLNPPLYLKTN